MDTNTLATHDASYSAIRTFLIIDRVGAVLGLFALILANIFLGEPLLWLVAAGIVNLIVLLSVGLRLLAADRRPLAVALATLGNWLIAVLVVIPLPQLWPVMILTVFMPVVLATPLVGARSLLGLMLAAAVAVALTASVGLLRDDDGVLDDLDDDLELLLVTGSLVAQLAPISLIVWNNSWLQRQSLIDLTEANRHLRQTQTDLAISRQRVVETADRERQQIERDLHDGAQQRLTALAMKLRMLEDETSNGFAQRLGELAEDTDEAIKELRRLAHGMYPPLLETYGLARALNASARSAPIAVDTHIAEFDRPDPSIERALYFTALEAVTNTAKHAPDASSSIQLHEEHGNIVLAVTDDGVGFASRDPSVGGAPGHGLHNISDRIAAVGGQLEINSTPGGTVIRAVVPCQAELPSLKLIR